MHEYMQVLVNNSGLYLHIGSVKVMAKLRRSLVGKISRVLGF